jgi:light-regulated signal transduction histidine kinase (bacteriophytochrome)
MNAMVEQVLHELQPDIEGRRIEFVIGRLGSAEADPALFKQALTNLAQQCNQVHARRRSRGHRSRL